MPRIKRSSPIIEKADQRLASLQSIDPNLDLSKGFTTQAFADLIETARRRVAAYNTTLSHLDADRAAMVEAEKAVSVFAEKMLIGVAFEYGKESREYEMAGGTRKSQRKRPSRRASEQASA
ncbi:hypothetical protein [Phormidesmis priestleyi]